MKLAGNFECTVCQRYFGFKDVVQGEECGRLVFLCGDCAAGMTWEDEIA